MRGEGEEEESLTLKPCKQGVLLYLCPLPFFFLSVFFLVKKGEWAELFIYGEGLGGRRKGRGRGLLIVRFILF